mmetsp:Transcript_5865/g.16502  ORF Transcript_5865/g.16502 Transcript_5865/m.16502 type:complete len:143 (+) Transcript_5865:216-644(+)
MSSPVVKAAAATSRQSKRLQDKTAQGRKSKTARLLLIPDVVDVKTLSPHIDVRSELGLEPIRALTVVGRRIPVPGDGNCGYHAAQRGLVEDGTIEPGTSIADFRRGLYDFAIANYLHYESCLLVATVLPISKSITARGTLRS